MTVLLDWKVEISADDVLRGQGADPAAVRKRSARLVDAAEKAAEEARGLVRPVVILKELEVASFKHRQIKLSDGHTLSGDLIGEHLAAAQSVALAACTISNALYERASGLMDHQPVQGLALDGAGNAAVESLAGEVCKMLEERAAARGWASTIPLNPGMIGWPVAEGQAQIFDILRGESDEIILNEAMLMVPLKSLSFIVGMGSAVTSSGSPCEYCVLRTTCRYQNPNAHA